MPQVKPNILFRFFSPKGRLSRVDFWILFGGFLLLWLVAFATLLHSGSALGDTHSQILLILLILAWLLIIPMGLRRQQDAGVQSRISNYTLAGSVIVVALLALNDSLFGMITFEFFSKLLLASLVVFAVSLIFNCIQWLRPSETNYKPIEATP